VIFLKQIDNKDFQERSTFWERFWERANSHRSSVPPNFLGAQKLWIAKKDAVGVSVPIDLAHGTDDGEAYAKMDILLQHFPFRSTSRARSPLI
jgi:hypothetical protein